VILPVFRTCAALDYPTACDASLRQNIATSAYRLAHRWRTEITADAAAPAHSGPHPAWTHSHRPVKPVRLDAKAEPGWPRNTPATAVSKAVRGHWPLEGSNPSPFAFRAASGAHPLADAATNGLRDRSTQSTEVRSRDRCTHFGAHWRTTGERFPCRRCAAPETVRGALARQFARLRE
jgi:hypothetical protein